MTLWNTDIARCVARRWPSLRHQYCDLGFLLQSNSSSVPPSLSRYALFDVQKSSALCISNSRRTSHPDIKDEPCIEISVCLEHFQFFANTKTLFSYTFLDICFAVLTYMGWIIVSYSVNLEERWVIILVSPLILEYIFLYKWLD